MGVKQQALEIAKQTKQASLEIANLKTDLKNQVLFKVANSIRKNAAQIIQKNQEDVALAKKNNLDDAKIDRLILDENRINNLANAVLEVASLKDPVGKITYDVERENGLHIRRISVPIGVILAIYESRPNVTSDIAALGFKSGNAVILRSGKESFNTSKKIAEIYQDVLREFNINPNCVSYVESTDREYVSQLLKMDKFIDVVIPRGGKELIKAITKSTKIPLFKHLDGNCHTYIESSADFEKAVKITLNAKMRRVGVCGATESLLIDQQIAKKLLPKIVSELNKAGCEVRGDRSATKICNNISKATDKDFYTEYLDKIISVKVVKNIDEAIRHINKYGSSHTESIITEDQEKTAQFFKEVNSAIVMHNASTQFADGGEFGLGAEVGISTGKLHARGPVGLEQLTIYKYIVEADCALRKI
ncbi:MAG: gamma-glutamyl phosphate reductase [Rickettsiaceae bacterium]|jgi:glutamate-5-semialdehyde dehydrogenase|nr:gamma-glutamyl phosphate reductase [Rickettsiaceae bacterium]